MHFHFRNTSLVKTRVFTRYNRHPHAIVDNSLSIRQELRIQHHVTRYLAVQHTLQTTSMRSPQETGEDAPLAPSVLYGSGAPVISLPSVSWLQFADIQNDTCWLLPVHSLSLASHDSRLSLLKTVDKSRW